MNEFELIAKTLMGLEPVPAKELLKTYDKNIRALRKFL